MCTAVSYCDGAHYFGRNLDLERSYGEGITITPRNYPLRFRCMPTLTRHYAMIGMAAVMEDYPLYFEATNEAGLSMAGLNFPGNAAYYPHADGRDNVSPFEFIQWIVGQCADIPQARALLARINLVDIPFSSALPLSPLHWLIADRRESIVAEATRDGMQLYDNPVGVLTNNPPFPCQMLRLTDYMQATAGQSVNRLAQGVDLQPYSLGLGAFGIPGDLSSASRFVRATFTKCNTLPAAQEAERVGQFFGILRAVAMQKGCVLVRPNEYEYTLYSSCCNADSGVYYYTTHENAQITAVDMHREDLEGCTLIQYPMLRVQQIRAQNQPKG